MNAVETWAIIRVMVSVISDVFNTSFVSVVMVDYIHYLFHKVLPLIPEFIGIFAR
jgi:hypothetical protein